jgi:hypothetical protein
VVLDLTPLKSISVLILEEEVLQLFCEVVNPSRAGPQAPVLLERLS